MKTMLTPFNASNEVQFKETPKMAKHGTGTTPADNALITASWARTMTKVIISRNNKKPPFWHVINFLGKAGRNLKGSLIFWPYERIIERTAVCRRAMASKSSWSK